MYKYVIFGLNVLSDIELGCYHSTFDSPDVTIRHMQCISEELVNGFTEIGVNRSIFSLKDKARFTIEDGKTIEIESFSNIPNIELELYILGTAMGTIMIQRDEFPIHGSFVSNENVGIAILGDSGAGKTTLATQFALNDWKIVTDDVMRINIDNCISNVHASYPSQKQWLNNEKEFKISIDKNLAIHNRIDKYYFSEKSWFSSKSLNLNYMFEIIESDVTDVTITELINSDKIDLLLRNSYRYFIIDYCQKHLKHLAFILKLSTTVKIYKIERPIGIFSVESQYQLINRIIGEKNGLLYQK